MSDTPTTEAGRAYLDGTEIVPVVYQHALRNVLAIEQEARQAAEAQVAGLRSQIEVLHHKYLGLMHEAEALNVGVGNPMGLVVRMWAGREEAVSAVLELMDALPAPAPTPDRLDVERLAKAITGITCSADGFPLDDMDAAEVIAAEYARLAASPRASEEDR